MVSGYPKNSRLRRNIIFALGSRTGPRLEQNLREKLRALYSNFSPTDVDSLVDEVLIEFEDTGVVKLCADNYIVLTNRGRDEYRSIAAKKELRHWKKSTRANLKKQERARKQKRAEPENHHENGKLELGRLAKLLGKNWRQEYKLVNPVVLDCVWYTNPLKISHAFEVQYRGSWKNAIGNLEAMSRYNEDCRLFAIVYDEQQSRYIQDLLGARLESSIKVLRASQISEWVAVLERTSARSVLKLTDAMENMKRAGILD